MKKEIRMTGKYLSSTLLIVISVTAWTQDQMSALNSYSFSFVQVDSSAYKPLYIDNTNRQHIYNEYGNFHEASLAIEKYALKNEGIDFLSRRKSDAGGWEIELTNGEIYQLIIPSQYDVADYTFEHYYKKKELIVFREQWGEGNGYLLFNRRTGESTSLWGPPSFSPNEKFFVAYNDDIDACYSPNGIQLFEMIRSTPTLVLKHVMTNAPSRMEWVDDNTFNLEVYFWGDLSKGFSGYEYDHYQVHITKITE